MKSSSLIKSTILLVWLLTVISSIEIAIHEAPRCMILTSTFQPIKVQIKFPKIPNKLVGQRFRITLRDFITEQQISYEFAEQDSLFRKNLKLQTDKLYHICFQVIKVRNYFKENEQIYINYVATQDFQSLIGRIQIPPELNGQQNLQSIYKVAKQLTSLNKNILENQRKQRQLEDTLVKQNVHKNQRIYTLTLVQLTVIVLSGAYQVFALRRFLIQKNLY